MSTTPIPSTVSPIAPLREVRLGSGVVVARGDVVVLIAELGLDRAAQIWTAIGDDGSVDAVIDELARDGLRSIPNVAIAAAEGAQLRVIVRGSVTAEVVVGRVHADASTADAVSEGAVDHDQPADESAVAADTVVLDGAGVKSWSEQIVTDWSSCALRIHPSGAPNSETVTAGDDAVYLSAGVIFGSAVAWDRWRDATEARCAAENSVPGSVAAPEVSSGVSNETEPPVSQYAEVEERPGQNREAELPEPEHAGALQSPATGDGDQDADDPYAVMFGRTVHRDVQTAAVADTEVPSGTDATSGLSPSDTHEVDSVSTRSFADFEQAQAASRRASAGESESPIADDGDHDGHTMTVAELQRLRARSEPAAPPATTPPRGDHDGHTISLAELRRMRGGEPTPQASDNSSGPTPVGPTVQAIACPQGHPNPSYASSCRLCGQQLGGPIVIVARPPLGRLRSSTGEVVELDRPIIVGRNPSLSGRRLSEIPREWRISSADGLSRSHAMFHIDGWQVRVEDLGSANSTTVTLPGREPEMLRAGEPMLITDGALVDLGGEVTCRYEATV